MREKDPFTSDVAPLYTTISINERLECLKSIRHARLHHLLRVLFVHKHWQKVVELEQESVSRDISWVTGKTKPSLLSLMNQQCGEMIPGYFGVWNLGTQNNYSTTFVNASTPYFQRFPKHCNFWTSRHSAKWTGMVSVC